MKPPVGTRLNQGCPLSARMVSCYPLHEGGGRIVEDLVRPRFAGTLDADCQWKTGPNGLVLDFPGTGTIALPSYLFSSNILSISISFMTRDAAASAALFSIFTANDNAVEIWQAGFNDCIWGGCPSGGRAFTAAGSIVAGVWYHAVLTVDGTTSRMYLNGQRSGNDAYPQFTTFSPVGCVGNRAPPIPYWPFDGAIRDIELFGCALSPSEVQQLYMDQWAFMAPQSPRIRYFIPSTAEGGLSIPVAMASYRQRWR